MPSASRQCQACCSDALVAPKRRSTQTAQNPLSLFAKTLCEFRGLRVVRRDQCGLVAGAAGVAGAGRLLGVEAEPDRARVDVPGLRARVVRFRVRFDFAAAAVPVDARDVTCDVCLVRCLTVFFGAASAETLRARAASSEQKTSTSRLRSIRNPPCTR